MTETTGERLRRLRGKRTLAEVSRDCGISTSALAMYEQGHRIPRDPIKVKLAAYYGRSVAYIFFNTSTRETRA